MNNTECGIFLKVVNDKLNSREDKINIMLNNHGISSKGNMKDVLISISKEWTNFEQLEKENLSELLFGKYYMSKFICLMDNSNIEMMYIIDEII